jgi:predicted nucleic acid-binding protein
MSLQSLSGEIWRMRGSVTPYDAAHVAVARAAGCPLLTADARLAKSVPAGTSIILV